MKRFYIIAIAFAMGIFSSCSDFLIEEPELSQSDEITLSNFEGLDKATAGVYAYLPNSAWYGVDFILMNEMRTSNGKKYFGSQFDTGRMITEYSFIYTPGTTSAVWSAGYTVIANANKVMANLEGKASQEELDNLKAECLFLRALAHFDVVRTYAQPYCFTADASHIGVPVITTVQSATDMPKRETVAKVYEQILADLTEAEEIIDPAYARAGAKNIRSVVSLEAIQALLSRVYLYSEQWQKSADYATKVIDSKEFTMWTKEQMKEGAVYAEDVRRAGEGEVIFEAYMASGELGGGNEGISSMTTPDSYGDAGASLDIVELYEEGDVRKELFFSEDHKDNGSPIWFTKKYYGKGQGDPDYSNVIILRLSEMYLNRAEAIIKGASVAGVTASADLQVIADNRGSKRVVDLATWDKGVYLERRKELAWEAHLWFDLARTKQDMVREDVAGTATPKSLTWGADQWAMPIPSREINVNKNLEQNKGYQK